MINLVLGAKEARVSRLSLLGAAMAAAAWILVAFALRFDRPGSFCEVTRANAHLRDASHPIASAAADTTTAPTSGPA